MSAAKFISDVRYKIRDRWGGVKHWWKYRWFRRHQTKLRRIAAWAVHHQANGGIHDDNSIMKGYADRRIYEAAYEQSGGKP